MKKQLYPAMLILILGLCAQAQEVGYMSRDCGFDMNRDGLIGQTGDCDVCDGVTTDPDGDGVDEHIVYINCDGGTDGTGCGTPGSPCATIDYAWGRQATIPDDGIEVIFCFRGTCAPENLEPGVPGQPGYYTVPASGSQARDWQYPVNPTMLVGWDADNDGKYPPEDPDDVAVLDGSGGGPGLGLVRAFRIGAGADHLEMAHFTARDYGRYVDGEHGGFLRFGNGGGAASHIYLHDLHLENINKDQVGGSHRITFDFFVSGTELHHVALTNLNITDTSSFLNRGDGGDLPGQGIGDADFGPLRWQNLSVTVHGKDYDPVAKLGGFFTGWKLWGYMSGLEILDSTFDANVSEWQPLIKGEGGMTFVHASQCSQDWTVRNNVLTDFQTALNVTGGNGDYCKHDTTNTPPTSIPRPVDGIVFDRNTLLNTYGSWQDITPVSLKGGDDPDRTTRDVTITNNMLVSLPGYKHCIWSHIGNDEGANGGHVVIAGNTCYGALENDDLAAVLIGEIAGTPPAYPLENYTLTNNLVAGLNTGDVALRTTHVPAGWASDANLFPAGALYRWNDGTKGNLAAWKTASGDDAASFEGAPTFFNPAQGDMHLHPNDVTAQNAGVSMTGVTEDRDGQARGQGVGWDIGADEVPSGPTTPPLRFDGTPSGSLPKGTTGVVLALDTDEACDCRYSDTPGTAYASMTDMTTTGGTHHEVYLSGLADNQSYTYAVRCKDTSDNINDDDYLIPFINPENVFHPTDLGTLAFFVETAYGIQLATCGSQACYDNPDTVPLPQQYCDMDRFPGGCVRRWTDQSGYVPPGGYDDPEWTEGRDFGQDDNQKPGLIPNCLNGLPCVRGGADEVQDLSFEVELPNMVDDLTGPFSIYLLARPVPQTADFAYFGVPSDNLFHNVTTNALRMKVNGSAQTLTVADAVAIGAWQLVEIHRDANDDMLTLVNGTNVTSGTPNLPGPFDFRFLFSNQRLFAFHGDMAAFTIVDDALTIQEKQDMRDYFQRVYNYQGLSSGPDETAPVLSFGTPSGLLPSGTTSVDIGVISNEACTCRYSDTPGTAYASMSAFDQTGGLVHEKTVTGLVPGNTYSWYVRCQDGSGNTALDDYTIQATVAVPTENLPGLVGYWPLDDGSGALATDVSGNDNHGSVTGTPTWLGTAVETGGMQLDGTDDLITVTDNGTGQPLDLTGAFTLSVWVKPSDLSGNRKLISKDNSYELEFGHAGTGLVSVRLNNLRRGAGTTQLAVDTWQMVTVTWDGETVRYYLDGAPDGTAAFSGTLTANNTDVGIGARPAGYLAGALDEVRIYNRALSPKAVTALYQETTADLVAWWTMDDLSEVAEDLSAGLHHAELHGDAAAAATTLTGGAMDLDGSGDFASVADPGSNWPLDLDGPFTLIAWVNPRALTGNQALVSKDNIYEFELGDAYSDAYSLRLNNARYGLGTTRLTTDTWQHLAVSWDGTTVRYYYNGQPDGTAAFSGTLNTNDLSLGLGARPGDYFNGRLDDVRIYAAALSDAAVEAAYTDDLPFDPNADLIAAWNLDEGTGCTAADSAGDHDGALGPVCASGPTWFTDNGVVGAAFDGTDEIRVTHAADLHGMTAFTISAWIRHDATTQWRAILDKRDNGNDGYDLFIDTSSRLLMRLNNEVVTGTSTVADGTWHHVAGTYDGTDMRVYVDGTLEATSTVGTITLDVTADLLLGMHYSSSTYAFDGDLTQVRLYSRALDAAELTELAQ